jgi:hypothetical protein
MDEIIEFLKKTLILIFLAFFIILAHYARESPNADSVWWKFEKVPSTVKTDFFNEKRNAHVLVDPGYYIWGMAVMKWSDGKYHGYYARWPKEQGFQAWMTDCEIAHAVADKPEGPFKFVNIVLKSRNEKGWDVVNSHNPAICVADGKICLYYISNDLRGKYEVVQGKHYPTAEWLNKNRELVRNSQRIGVAVATDPSGPFKRAEMPVVEPDNKLFKNIAVNPAVTYVDGKFVMIMKGDEVGRDSWFRIQLVGHSKNPEGPFIFEEDPVYNKEQTEDAGIWYDHQKQKYFMTCHVMGKPDLALFSSENGSDWEIHEHVFSKKEVWMKDGTIWKPDRVERPFVFTDERGKPVCLYVAIKDENISGNIAIPFDQNSYDKKLNDKSGSLDFQKLIPDTFERSFIFRLDDYMVWGADMVSTEDGTYHLFFSHWPEDLGFDAWVTHSMIGYATAPKPEGPYSYKGIALPPRGEEYWDGHMTHNPSIVSYRGKYYIYYTGSSGPDWTPERSFDNKSSKRWRYRMNQRVGVAVADHPSGPWKRFEKPLLDVPEYGSGIVATPCAMVTPDEKVFLYYKTQKQGVGRFGGGVYHYPSVSNNPLGPFTKVNTPLVDKNKLFPGRHFNFHIDDHEEWYYEDRFYAIVKDHDAPYLTEYGKILYLLESSDGVNWTPSAHPFVEDRTIIWNDGAEKKYSRLEMPKIYLEKGFPRVLFLAARPVSDSDENSYNIAVPLKN